MKLAISCLGVAIHTQYSQDTWAGYIQLRIAQKFAGLLADDLRPHLALNTFLVALQRRNKLMLKRR